MTVKDRDKIQNWIRNKFNIEDINLVSSTFYTSYQQSLLTSQGPSQKMTSATSLGLVDLKQTFFDYPELSKISGEPTLGSLMTLCNELKANAQSVTTTLGGGANGHLGLVLSAQAYEQIAPGTPYIRPVLPEMDIDNNDTRYILAQKRLDYDTDLALYREFVAMERILIQQIVNAIDGKFLKAIRSKTMNKINKTIPDILTYLFETYGDVSPQEFQSHFRKVQRQLQRTGDLTVEQTMDNEQLINMVSSEIVQKVQQALDMNQQQVNDENLPPVADTPKPTEELLLALTQKMDAFGQALATIQQKVPMTPMQPNPYCTFIPPQGSNFSYPPYPTPPQQAPLQPSGPPPPKPA